MRVEYQGAHDGVDVHLPSGIVRTVMRGDAADFPDDVAESLLEQAGQWKRVAAAKTPKEA